MRVGPAVRCPLHQRSLSRRQFVGATAGLVAGGGFVSGHAQGGNPHTNAAPTPIPGGVSPFGVFIHHFPVGPSSTHFRISPIRRRLRTSTGSSV